MKLMHMVVASAFAAVAGFAPLYASGTDEKVTVTGCAVRGDGDGDGFLLANAADQTSPTRMLYWLDDDDHAVANMMGHLVEITGEVEGDIKRGEIKAERENGMIELEIKAADRKATVKLPDVPSAVGTSGSVTDREVELPYIVQKLDVKSARSVAPSCK